MKMGTARRWLRRWTAGFLVSILFGGPTIGAQSVTGNRVLLPGQTGLLVQYAIVGAKKRLEHPACAEMLAEFRAPDGRPLAAHISLPPADYLSTLWFVPGDDDWRCRTSGGPVTFTAPGHTVIHVCSSRFTRQYLNNQRYAEVLLIHEMLHAAGLGENPPTSDQISRVAMARCASL